MKTSQLKVIMLNPATLYTVVWLTVLIFYNLRLSRILLPLNTSTLVMILGGIGTGFLASVIANLWFSNQKKTFRFKQQKLKFQPNNINKFTIFLKIKSKQLFLFWLTVSTIEIIYSRGIPILWIFTGSGKTYLDFGISSFSIHGLNNSIYMFLSLSVFFIYIIEKEKKYLIYFLGLLLWSVLIIKRQLFLSILIECIFIYLITQNKILSIKLCAKFSFSLIVISWFFGFIGDVRHSFADMLYAVAQPSEAWPSFLPSIYLWFYIYITSPINNIVANIDIIRPTYTPINTLNRILPSAITNLLLIDNTHDYNFKEVVPVLNVSTFYKDFLLDFGVLGAIFMVFIIQIYSSVLFKKTILFGNQKPWLYLSYAVIFQSLFFSIFDNVLLHPAFLFQLIISSYIGNRFRLKYLKLPTLFRLQNPKT